GVAGPSEILVVADRTADARVVAADLLSQAEHDEAAYALLVCDDASFAGEVARAVDEQLAVLPRLAIARASIDANGAAFVASSRARMAEIADAIAAEHLSLQVDDPESMLDRVRAAGAVFLGGATPEAAGDYVA